MRPNPGGHDGIAVAAVLSSPLAAIAAVVAYLPRTAAHAAHDLAVDDEPHPDAGVDRYVRERPHPAGEALRELPDRREVDVVVNQQRHVKPRPQRSQRVKLPVRADVVGKRRHPMADLVNDLRRRDRRGQEALVRRSRPIDDTTGARDTLDGARAALAGSEHAERLSFLTSVAEAVAGADLVMESVPESLELKLGVLAEAERGAAEGAVVVTSTSSLPLDRVAAALRAPERFLGWHWFNPAHLIPLVEVVPTAVTDPGVVEWSVRRLEMAGKRPLVLARPVDGFLANRLQYALIREALALVDAGVATPEQIDAVLVDAGVATPEQIDAVLTDCVGLRWAVVGPMRSTDLADVTTAVAVATELFPKLSNADRPPAALTELAEQGRLGLSTGEASTPTRTRTRSWILGIGCWPRCGTPRNRAAQSVHERRGKAASPMAIRAIPSAAVAAV